MRFHLPNVVLVVDFFSLSSFIRFTCKVLSKAEYGKHLFNIFFFAFLSYIENVKQKRALEQNIEYVYRGFVFSIEGMKFERGK
jgi:hypothetical protein